MNSSSEKAMTDYGSNRSIRRLLVFCALAFAVGLFIAKSQTVFETPFWIAGDIKLRSEAGEWEKAHITDVSKTGQPIEILATVSVPNSGFPASSLPESNSLESGVSDMPVGVLVSGPFSAAVYWDGELIGQKGLVGDDNTPAVAGPIDSIHFLPAKKLSAGDHELRLVLSTAHLNYDAKRIVHLLGLVPYRGDDRRSLRYYFAPLLLMGGLFLMLVYNARFARSAGSKQHTVLALFTFFIIVNLVTEVSRAIINYSYDLHMYRGFLLWASAICAGASLTFLTSELKQKNWMRVIQAVGLLVFIANKAFGIGGDRQIVHDFMILAAIPALIYAVYAFKNGLNIGLTLSLFWVAALACQWLSYGLFLDVYIYIAAITFLSFHWFGTYMESASLRVAGADQAAENDAPYLFAFKNMGREYYINSSNVLSLRAIGNFTELLDKDGKTHLHAKRLGSLMEEVPLCFMRVHRSVSVNMNYVSELKSAQGSRYHLVFTNGETAPVSRYRVNEVRARMQLAAA